MNVKAGATVANVGWLAASLPEWLRFRHAAADVEAVQKRILLGYLRKNAATRFGQAHGFAQLESWEDYSERVPVRTYDDFAPWIERIAQGEQNILTSENVNLLEPSSGSSGPEKWIPYTRTLQSEYLKAVAAWMTQNFINSPRLVGGRAYWSLTPQPTRKRRARTRIPVGFDDDSAYLGGIAGRVIEMVLVSRPELKKIRDMERFRHVTLLLLLKCRDLRLISVWHPSYLLLLTEHLELHWRQLLKDLREGFAQAEPGLRIAANPRRADELERLDAQDFTAIWPALGLISCWGDANAKAGFEDIRASFPGVDIQAKGLVATEAFATLPFNGFHPLAIRSHFFEFIDDEGVVWPSWSLENGKHYSIVVTTGGGLYRYRLQDRVEVTGFFNDLPSLRFVGKEDNVSDHFGEKLDEAFVASCFRNSFEKFDLVPQFAMLAMDLPGNPPGYTLYVQCAEGVPPNLEEALESELCRNPHYELCVNLGQLRPVRAVRIADNAFARYSHALTQRGMRLGDIKPAPLSRFCDWSSTFP